MPRAIQILAFLFAFSLSLMEIEKVIGTATWTHSASLVLIAVGGIALFWLAGRMRTQHLFYSNSLLAFALTMRAAAFWYIYAQTEAGIFEGVELNLMIMQNLGVLFFESALYMSEHLKATPSKAAEIEKKWSEAWDKNEAELLARQKELETEVANLTRQLATRQTTKTPKRVNGVKTDKGDNKKIGSTYDKYHSVRVMRHAGASWEEIATEHDASVRTVQRWLNKLNEMEDSYAVRDGNIS